MTNTWQEEEKKKTTQQFIDLTSKYVNYFDSYDIPMSNTNCGHLALMEMEALSSQKKLIVEALEKKKITPLDGSYFKNEVLDEAISIIKNETY